MRIRTLQKVAKVINGYAFKSAQFNTSSGTPLIRIRDVVKGFTETYYDGEIPKGYWVEKSDILVGMDGDFNTCRWPSDKALLNQRVCKIEVLDSNKYDSRFLSYLLPVYLKLINEHTSATTVKHLSSKTLSDLPIPNPSVDEQKRIADKLDSVLAKVEATQSRLDKIPTILKRFRQSVLAAATSGELTKDWREGYDARPPTIDLIEEYWIEEFAKQKRKFKSYPHQNSGLNNIGWLHTTLGVICDVHIGSTPKRTESSYWGGDVKWVSSSEVAFCEIYDTKEKITSDGLDNTSTKIHPSGTVMLAMIGQGKTRGQPAILRTEACHNQNTAALRVSEPFLLPEYLYYLLWERYEETRKIGGGNNQKALNKAVVQSIEIDLPSIEEQAEIVRIVAELFSNADLVEKQYKAAKLRVDKMTQSILARAFSGKLFSPISEDDRKTAVVKTQSSQPKQSEAEKTGVTQEKTKAQADKIEHNLKTQIKVESTPATEDNPAQAGEVFTMLNSNNKGMSAQALFDELSDNTFSAIDDLFSELKKLIEQKVVIQSGEGESSTFKVIKK
tara:strand:+ start:34 stop:1707 length:1674 start_codon:yes stop_codon:yes gene_type:complete